MTRSTTQFASPEPFDAALLELYKAKSNARRYRNLVSIGADAGDPLALYAAATMYLHGDVRFGVRKSVRRAIPLLSRAALTVNRAMYDLAVCYEIGAGVKRNFRRAYELYVRAASLGHLSAMFEQAECLAVGQGVAKDVARARRIQRMASKLRARTSRELAAAPLRKSDRE